MTGRSDIHHLHEMAAVDDGIELRAINADVVAHIAQFLHHAWIALGVEVLQIDARSIVKPVERTFVGAHVALV